MLRSAAMMEFAERQLAEVEILGAMFPEDGAFEIDSCSRQHTQSWLDNECRGSAPPPVEFCVRILQHKIRGQPLSLLATLPSNYPQAPPAVRLRWSTVDADCVEAISEAMWESAEDALASESESVMGMVLHVQQAAAEEAEQEEAKEARRAHEEGETRRRRLDAAEKAAADASHRQRSSVPVLGRRLIVSHHIINETKRANVIEWAGELRLGGYSKYGWPGIIVVEGAESDCVEYVKRLKALRWQYLHVKGEESFPGEPGRSIDSLRQLPMAFEELGQDALGELAALCKAADIEGFYIGAMGLKLEEISVADLPNDKKKKKKESKADKKTNSKTRKEKQEAEKQITPQPEEEEEEEEEEEDLPLPKSLSAGASGALLLQVRAKPGAKMSAVMDVGDEAIVVALQAPPREGEANEECIRFLGAVLGLKKKGQLSLVSGHKSRDKVVQVQAGIATPHGVAAKLRAEVG